MVAFRSAWTERQKYPHEQPGRTSNISAHSVAIYQRTDETTISRIIQGKPAPRLRASHSNREVKAYIKRVVVHYGLQSTQNAGEEQYTELLARMYRNLNDLEHQW